MLFLLQLLSTDLFALMLIYECVCDPVYLFVVVVLSSLDSVDSCSIGVLLSFACLGMMMMITGDGQLMRSLIPIGEKRDIFAYTNFSDK